MSRSPLPPPEDSSGRPSPHPQSHSDFLAKLQSSTRVLVAPQSSSPPQPSYQQRQSYHPPPPPQMTQLQSHVRNPSSSSYTSSIASSSTYPYPANEYIHPLPAAIPTSSGGAGTGRPLSRVVESPTPSMRQSNYHLPSRAVISPSPINSVPIDNFAAPRSDSALAYSAAGLHRRNQSSEQWDGSGLGHGSGGGGIGGAGRQSGEADTRTLSGESRHRFTIGDTYEYNGGIGGGEKKASPGWEEEGGRRNR
ncbi:hypothetical protein P7C70_g7477, partial [Phenoliferia sp. Uapishka_3]